MCILFFLQNEKPFSDGYRLVLANNRDELWSRPTKTAHFWGKHEECISGLDEEPGRNGGTWLGVSKSGKIGALLNILGQMDFTKIGRGHMVTDYISGPMDVSKYARQILDNKDKYNGFNLVLFDLGATASDSNQVVHPILVSNAVGYSSSSAFTELPVNTPVGISNSPMEHPFQKAEKGQATFGQVVARFPLVKDKEALVGELTRLMLDRTCLLPDPVLESKAQHVFHCTPLRVRQQSAINVWAPEGQYGSRTTTILLVDSHGNVDYIERTIDPSQGSETEATTLHQSFQLTRNISH